MDTVRRLLKRFILMLLCALAVPASAQAQWDPGATMALGANLGALNLSIGNMSWGRQSLQAGMAGATRRHAGQPSRRPVPSATRGGPSPTDFVRSPAITRQVEDSFIDAIAARGGSNRTELAAAFRQADIPGAFEKFIAPYQYRSTDLADVMTAYWIVSWALARNAPDPSPTAIRAVRDALKISLGNEPPMPPDVRQGVADTLIYQTILEMAAIRDLQAKGDRQGVERIRAQIMHDFKALGIQLDHIEITDAGFGAR